eukprot:PITA_26971
MAWRFYFASLTAMIMALGIDLQLVECKVPALFVFGDSLLDTGNNNNLSTMVKATSPPYGNYPPGTSGGRFSNGPVITDFVAARLNMPSPPPALAIGSNIKRGVNFASGGSGILDSTGERQGQHISLGSQIKSFGGVKRKLKVQVGTSMASSIISKAIFLIATGTNDYFTYYFTAGNPAYLFYSPEDFAELVISNFTIHVKSLYNLGARKFAVSSLPIMGCTPFVRKLYGNRNGECAAFLQEAAQSHNKKLFTTVMKLQAKLSESHFMYTNIYKSSLKIYKNPAHYGIINENDACCRGKLNFGLCYKGISVCADSSHYYYFDGYHPTSLVHKIISSVAFTGKPPFVFPYNLKTLASLP